MKILLDASKNLWRVSVILFCAAALLLAVAAYDFAYKAPVLYKLQNSLDSLANEDSPAGEARRRDQAEDRFLICTRVEESQIRQEARNDAKSLCEGYTTLEDSYESQDVSPPTKENP